MVRVVAVRACTASQNEKSPLTLGNPRYASSNSCGVVVTLQPKCNAHSHSHFDLRCFTVVAQSELSEQFRRRISKITSRNPKCLRESEIRSILEHRVVQCRKLFMRMLVRLMYPVPLGQIESPILNIHRAPIVVDHFCCQSRRIIMSIVSHLIKAERRRDIAQYSVCLPFGLSHGTPCEEC